MTDKLKLGDLRRTVRDLRRSLASYAAWSTRATAEPHRPHPRAKADEYLEKIRQGGIVLVPLLEAEPGHRVEPCHLEDARQALAEAGEVLRPYLEEVTARHRIPDPTSGFRLRNFLQPIDFGGIGE